MEDLVGDFNFTIGFIAITAIAWLIYDIFLYAKDKKTISYYIVNWAYYSPMVPFIAGILMGHWFW